jgi:hypothetical protein
MFVLALPPWNQKQTRNIQSLKGIYVNTVPLFRYELQVQSYTYSMVYHNQSLGNLHSFDQSLINFHIFILILVECDMLECRDML